ncbi:winged helix-turn-helix transcriptional regulator [Chitinophaga sp. Hz27]|uniref:winged helix-turn-helix transcriptional regulator n=1 Tax=Chitinophaga sp. Hz27 TaxID=3347169 RepID=UPI0035E04E68
MTKRKPFAPCPAQYLLALHDTLNVISGKWKLYIIGAIVSGSKRFKEIERSIPNINPRMLSKELKELEINGIITRKVHSTAPVVIEYEVTASGQSIKNVLDVMVEWGLEHRKNVLGDTVSIAS